MPATSGDDAVLDNPVWWALAGAQRRFAVASDGTARFDPDVAPFGAFAGTPTAAQWTDLAALAPGQGVVLMGETAPAPPGWTVTLEGPGVQMVCDRLAPGGRAGPECAAVELGAGDVADMLALIEVARPGPFRPRTHELGRYVGIRDEGRLVAMAGERLRLPGYVEVSAVATHPAYRRRGLAGQLVREIVGGILGDGRVALLSAAAGNEAAIRLYEQLGFRLRRQLHFRALRPPPTAG